MTSEIQDLEESLLQAIADGDVAALDAHLADGFVITTAGWLREPASRSQWLEGLSAHTLHTFRVLSVDQVAVGNAVVALVLSSQQGELRGESYDLELRYTDVWTPDERTRWRLAVRHASIVPPVPR